MSLISDALKKAQLQRGIPSANWVQPQPAYASTLPANPTSSRRLILLNVVVLAAVAVGAIYFFDGHSTSARTAEQAPPVAAVPAAVNEPPSSTPSSSVSTTAPANAPSPFLAHEAPTAAAPSESPDYHLAGISSLGSHTLLSVVRQSDKRSLWIPVGKTIGEITAVSYDSENDRAVIRVHGRMLSIAMNDTGAPAEPAPKAAE
jgi:hypothetical protein